MKSISEIDLFNIGFISKPSGFAGELIFAIENGELQDYFNCKFFIISLEGKPVPFYAEKIKMNGSNMIVKLEDINSEDTAKRFIGKKIFVEKTTSDPEVSEMDWDDLIGYQIFENVYGTLGTLESIEEYPQQIIAQCTVNNKIVLFPLHEDFIVKIDDRKKELHLKLPEGLLDVYLK